MFAAPPAVAAPAPADAPVTLEAAFVFARAAAVRAKAPASSPSAVLKSAAASVEEKLAAVDALQSKIPRAPRAQQAAALDALALAASSGGGQPPEVRAKALAVLGYALPPADDDAARLRALPVLLAALGEPAYRLYALRGLGPACHGLPKAGEAALLSALLDLLDGPLAGEERQTALTDLYSFVGPRQDLPARAPALADAVDARVRAPLERDPAAFVADPRLTPGARALEIASLWALARHRQALGDAAAGARMDALLDRLAAVETDATVLGWIRVYRTAAPPAPFSALRDSTTSRRPSRDEGP